MKPIPWPTPPGIPFITYRRTNDAYDLPSTVKSSAVKSSNDSWLATYQASLALAGVFVGVEVPLLFFFKTDSNFPNGIGSDAKQALLVLAYIDLFFSLSAAVSALILTLELSDGGTPCSSRSCEGRPLLTWLRWHWMFSLIGGTIFPIVQLLLYVWLEESNFVRITLSVIAVFAALPIAFLIPLPSGNGKRHGIVALDTRTARTIPDMTHNA